MNNCPDAKFNFCPPRKSFFPAALLYCAFILLLAAASRLQAAWPQDESDLPPDSQATFGQLDNGFRYVLLPNREPPERVSLRLLVKAGSLMETEQQRGLAHFVEHMAFKGTENFESAEMVAYFQRLGMAFGPDTNAHTGFDETVYYLELPDHRPELLRDGMLLLSDYAGRMLFPEDELERERGVILGEKKDRDSAEHRVFVEELSFLAPETLLPRRFPIGQKEVIKEASRELFLDFYHRWYDPRRMVLIAVGHVEPETLEPLIREYFGGLSKPDQPPAKLNLGRLPERGLEVRLHRESEAPEVRVSIQAAQSLMPRPDNSGRRSDELKTELATQMLTRRFDRLARQKEAPFNRGVAYHRQWFDFMSNPGITLTTRPEQWQPALAVLEKELRRALQHGFTQSEYEEAKARVLQNREQAVRQRETRNSRRLSSALTRTISRNRVWTAPETELEITRKILHETDPEGVWQAWRKLWPEQQRLVFIAGNLPEDATTEKAYQILAGSLLTTVDPPPEAETTPFAYNEFGEPGDIRRRTEHEDLGITKIEFANRTVLLVKTTEFEDDVIRIGFRFGAGLLSLPEDRPGLSTLAPAVFVEGGLEAHSKHELDRIFAGREVGVSFAVQDDAFVLEGRTSPRDLADQLRLMTAYLQAPGYREEAMQLAGGQLDRLYNQLRHTVRGAIQDQVENFIGGGDFRFGFPGREELDILAMHDVRDWLQPALTRETLTIAVVGDVEVDQAVRAVRQTAAALPPRQSEQEPHRQRRHIDFPAPGGPHLFAYPTETPRAAALVYWPTDDMQDMQRTRRLVFLADVISDRLRIRVREEMGEAYSLFAHHRASDTYEGFGYLRALVQCEPETAGSLVEIISEIGQRLAAGGIDEDEYQRIHAPLMASLREQVRNNQYWLRNVLLPARDQPRRLDWARNMTDDFAAITRQEINRLAQAYLPINRTLTVIVKPEEPVPAPEQGRRQVGLTPPQAYRTARAK